MNRANPSKFLAFTWLLVIGLITATNVVVANTDISAVTAAPIKPDRVILLDVAMAGKRIVAVGERGVVLLSDDNGKTWTSVRAPVTRTLTAVTFFDDKVGIAVGHGGSVLRTEDGGKTWVQVKIPEIGFDSVLGITKLGAKDVVAYGAFGMYIRSDDAGKTWTRPHILSKVESFDRHIYKVIKAPNAVVVVAENGSLGRSTDNGVTYEPIKSEYPGSYFGGVTAKDGSVVIFGMRGTVYRSTDSGAKWTKVPVATKTGFNNGLVLDDGTLILVGNSGLVAVSRDNGVTFTLAKTKAGRGLAQAILIGKDELLAVGESGVGMVDADAWHVPAKP